jgi:TetR/AcrR family transcriptional regulator
MPRAAEAPRQRRKPTELRQSELVDTALRLAALRGARGLTTARLAAAVGLSSGAIFRHFPTMDALVVAMTARLEALLFADLSPPPADPIERLGVFFQQRVRTLVEQPLLARLLQGDVLAHVGSGAGAAQVAAFKRRSIDLITQALREAEQGGLLGPAADVETGTVLVLGAVHAIGHAGALRTEDPAGLPGLAARVWATLETTLRGGPARVARPSPARRRVASRGGPHVKE